MDAAVVPRELRECLLFEFKRVPTCAPAVDKELRAAFDQIHSRGYARRYLDKALPVLPVAAVYKEDESLERAQVGERVEPGMKPALIRPLEELLPIKKTAVPL